MIGSGIFIVTAAMARDIFCCLAFNHLVSDWLDYRRCRIVTVN
jgi:hypothetical protein